MYIFRVESICEYKMGLMVVGLWVMGGGGACGMRLIEIIHVESRQRVDLESSFEGEGIGG